ncbi:pantetheine-phosphate adenylyltransferase-like protein [Annulohypoxylon maeteangense]|uniref:pantetheine-phosphate adenylyltransferase-like protein n=1 Tax=Annulohypoxylon maeteangense TaxID=1927788 RepID=UPI002007995B|nr:pantetheine-phosphate adenylyltransferase-like protein [Annulohypoxylon maeteangense]KAI0882363.1 pantetheine-phosphate adenylyltransferase-like protein [Annulohypoxylon maeteangense]
MAGLNATMGDDLPSLLLLPPPPHPATRLALNAAYEPPLKAAISKLKNAKTGKNGAILIVGLVSPILTGNYIRHKSLSWPHVQSLLADLYSIISVICVQLSVPTDIHAGPGSVDVRVVLVDHDLSKPLAIDSKPAIEPNNTVIINLSTFVSAYHPWRYILHTNNEPGYALLLTYLKLFEGIQTLKQSQIVVVDGGLAVSVGLPDSLQVSPQTITQPTVCLGGTFDHLHPGHKLLLTAAVLLLKVPDKGAPRPCQFIIGITGDELLKRKKYAEFVQPWDERAMNTIDFLSSILDLSKDGWKKSQNAQIIEDRIIKDHGELVAQFRNGTIEVRCVVIQDAYGPTITTENMDILVVSGETRSGGNAVNERRKDLGWRQLETFEVDVLDADGIVHKSSEARDFTQKISSTAIRKQKAQSHT